VVGDDEGETTEAAAVSGVSSISIDGTDYNCGYSNEKGGESYRSWDYIYVCLVFDNMVGGPKKVLFRPRLDKYELLEIRGLYDIFTAEEYAEETGFTVRALSNGVISRPTYFRLDGGIAEILNLVIEMEDGFVKEIDWKNTCIAKTCEYQDCIETVFSHPEAAGLHLREKNCFIRTCQSSKDTSNCDTKVYLTWIGSDSENRHCVSDNYRISHLTQFSIQSYYESAVNAAALTAAAEAYEDRPGS